MSNSTILRKKFPSEILEKVRKLKQPDNWSNLLYIASDYGLIALAIALAKLQPSPITYLLALLVIGSRMRAFENLTHEASHFRLFRNGFLNQWICLLCCSFPVGTSLYTYRKSHMLHHKWAGDPDKDPDYIRYRELGIDRFPLPRSELILHLLKVFCLAHVPKYLYGTIKFFVYSPEEPRLQRNARWIYWMVVFAILSIFGLWWDFFLFWVVPFLTAFQMLRYLAEMSEHGGLYGLNREVEITRNNFCHPVLRFFQYPHGDYYHLVHHLFPAIPHYNLGRTHRILLSDEEYQKAHHCYGYFLPSQPDRRSTLEEMMLEENGQAKDLLQSIVPGARLANSL